MLLQEFHKLMLTVIPPLDTSNADLHEYLWAYRLELERRLTGAEVPQGRCGFAVLCLWMEARDALEGGEVPPPPLSRASSLCPPTVPLTASASLNGTCNRQ